MSRWIENGDRSRWSAAASAWRVFGMVLAITAPVTAASRALAQQGTSAPGGLVHDRRLDESSGLAVSRRSASRFWTHNDSGDQPRLFAVDSVQRSAQAVEVLGAEAVDWEDMASAEIDGEPTLLVADVGDNARRRDSVELYLITEPDADQGGSVHVRRQIRIRYPDGPMDCEAIAVDASAARVLLIGKERLPWAGVYAVPLQGEGAADGAVEFRTAQRVGTIAVPMITAMDIRADGRQMAVASYLDLFLFERAGDESWEDALRRLPRHVAMPKLKQIEAVCYDQAGALWVTSEGDPLPLVRVEAEAKGTE